MDIDSKGVLVYKENNQKSDGSAVELIQNQQPQMQNSNDSKENINGEHHVAKENLSGGHLDVKENINKEHKSFANNTKSSEHELYNRVLNQSELLKNKHLSENDSYYGTRSHNIPQRKYIEVFDSKNGQIR